MSPRHQTPRAAPAAGVELSQPTFGAAAILPSLLAPPETEPAAPRRFHRAAKLPSCFPRSSSSRSHALLSRLADSHKSLPPEEGEPCGTAARTLWVCFPDSPFALLPRATSIHTIPKPFPANLRHPAKIYSFYTLQQKKKKKMLSPQGSRALCAGLTGKAQRGKGAAEGPEPRGDGTGQRELGSRIKQLPACSCPAPCSEGESRKRETPTQRRAVTSLKKVLLINNVFR